MRVCFKRLQERGNSGANTLDESRSSDLGRRTDIGLQILVIEGRDPWVIGTSASMALMAPMDKR